MASEREECKTNLKTATSSAEAAADVEHGGSANGGYKSVEEEPFSSRLWGVVKAVLPAGLMAFGGPSAHIAVMHDLFIERLKWLTPQEFNELLALGMVLPGPTSTELCIAVATYRAGVVGGLVAFVLWSLPSFVVLTAAGLGMQQLKGDHPPDWMIGLAPAAIVLIFVAFYKLAQKVVVGRLTFSLTLLSACITLLVQGDPRVPSTTLLWLLPVMLVGGGLATLAEKLYLEHKQKQARPVPQQEGGEEEHEVELSATSPAPPQQPASVLEGAVDGVDTYKTVHVPRWFVAGSLLSLAGFLLFLLARRLQPHPAQLGPFFELFSQLFIMGITIYGGGQVVLPMLISVAVKPGWITMQQFLQGYALAQLLPGPLFNISAYIGAAYLGIRGAFVGWVALFLPGLLLVISLLPLWHRFRRVPNVKPFLVGVNATGLGLILAVGVSIYLQVIRTPADAIVSLISAGLSVYGGYNSLVAVLVGGVAGFLLSNTCLALGQRPYTRY